jgi:hypothetical protein
VRPRLRRLLSIGRKPSAAAQPSTREAPAQPSTREAPAQPSTRDDPGRREAERRLADAQRRLKQAVPPRED